MRIHTLLLAAGLAGAAPLAAGKAHIEGGFIDRSGHRESDGGIRLGGAADLTATAAAFGELIDTGTYEQLTAGLGVRAAIRRGLQATAGASVEAVDTDHRGSDLGLGLRAGLTWQVPQFHAELTPEIRHLSVADSSATSLRLGGIYFLSPEFQLSGALQGGDDDRLEVGLRRSF